MSNPNGKKGCKEHQDQIQKVADEVEKNGLKPIREFLVRLFNGKTRFVDVAGLDENRQVQELHQVGVANKNGTPVKRERNAIDEIEKATGKKVKFHAYKVALILLVVSIMLYFMACH